MLFLFSTKNSLCFHPPCMYLNLPPKAKPRKKRIHNCFDRPAEWKGKEQRGGILLLQVWEEISKRSNELARTQHFFPWYDSNPWFNDFIIFTGVKSVINFIQEKSLRKLINQIIERCFCFYLEDFLKSPALMIRFWIWVSIKHSFIPSDFTSLSPQLNRPERNVNATSSISIEENALALENTFIHFRHFHI